MLGNDCKGLPSSDGRYLDRCVTSPDEVTGHLLLLSAAVLMSSAQICTTCRMITSKNYLRLVISSLLVKSLGLMGALLSRQMTLVILYDMVAVFLGSVVMIVVFAAWVHRKTTRHELGGGAHYKQIPQLPVQSQVSSRHTTTCKVFCYAALPLIFLGLVLCMVASWEPIQRHVERHTNNVDNESFTSTAYYKPYDAFVIVGYIMGCISGVGQVAMLWGSIRQRAHNMAKATNQKTGMPTTSKIATVLSDVMYVAGTLFQSASWIAVETTLPWTTRSVIEAALLIHNISTTAHKNKQRQETHHEDDCNLLSEVESSSESNSSDVLWDQAWKPQCDSTLLDYYDKPNNIAFNSSALRLMKGGLSSASDSTSTSDEQEMECENARSLPSTRQTQPLSRHELSHASHPSDSPFHRLGRPLIPLTLNIPESCNQRVRTWISNSTPEDEIAPRWKTLFSLDIPSPNDDSVIADVRSPPLSFPRKFSV